VEEKELKAALVEHKGDIQKIVDAMSEASGKEKAELQKSLDEANGTMGVMQKQLDDIATEQKNAKINKKETVVTFVEDLRKQLNAEIENIKGVKASHKKELMISVKSFLETATASVTTGSLIPWPQRDPSLVKAPDRQTFMIDIVARGIASSLTLYYVERKTRTDNSEWVDEGVAPSSQTVLGYTTQSVAMQNLSSFLKISNNALDDIEWIMSEIQTELVTLQMLKLDAALLSGTSGGDEGFDGVQTAATAFAAGGDKVPLGQTATRYDALMFAVNQIDIANFSANFIVLHPSDLRDMKLERNADGDYYIPIYTQSNPQVDGVPIISNSGQTKGTFLVGDFQQAKYWTRKDMELRIWEQNETDAVAQLKTITLYSRGVLVIPTAKKLAFVTDTFTAAITEITNP
jgi:HK97 family phage major capsid protein